ncbi:MAG TPA: hypothetical protein VL972_01040 [Solirubrobacteraceae bacterium]|nr:hypothetical protein [Solirubrobacteraceae bacterium]
MPIELLYWDGCPSHSKALAELRAAIRELGLSEEVLVRAVRSEPDARRERFVGSPTIRIDGRDIQPTGDEPYGLTCRVYRRRDGRFSPTPDPADLRDALRAARPGGEPALPAAPTGAR